MVLGPAWGLPGIFGTDFMNFCSYVFLFFVFFKIRTPNVMVMGGPVGAAVGPEYESFLLPREAWALGHTGL